MQRQTAVTADLKSEQLLLFAFVAILSVRPSVPRDTNLGFSTVIDKMDLCVWKI